LGNSAAWLSLKGIYCSDDMEKLAIMVIRVDIESKVESWLRWKDAK